MKNMPIKIAFIALLSILLGATDYNEQYFAQVTSSSIDFACKDSDDLHKLIEFNNKLVKSVQDTWTLFASTVQVTLEQNNFKTAYDSSGNFAKYMQNLKDERFIESPIMETSKNIEHLQGIKRDYSDFFANLYTLNMHIHDIFTVPVEYRNMPPSKLYPISGGAQALLNEIPTIANNIKNILHKMNKDILQSYDDYHCNKADITQKGALFFP